MLPLFARLSAASSRRVFAPHSARRIVLATNVAETSLTIPGIVYVVDTGIARVNRYSFRSKVDAAAVEPISRRPAPTSARAAAAASQSGVCFRLYDEAGLRGAAALHRPGDPARRRSPA